MYCWRAVKFSAIVITMHSIDYLLIIAAKVAFTTNFMLSRISGVRLEHSEFTQIFFLIQYKQLYYIINHNFIS